MLRRRWYTFAWMKLRIVKGRVFDGSGKPQDSSPVAQEDKTIKAHFSTIVRIAIENS